MLEYKHPTVYPPKFYNQQTSTQPLMCLNQALARLNAVHATLPTEKKESTHKELDISASKETSMLLKILSSTNLPRPTKPQEVLPTETPHAPSTTKVPKILEDSALLVSTHAPTVVELVQVPQELSEHLTSDFFIASLLYLLINFPRNYSLVHF